MSFLGLFLVKSVTLVSRLNFFACEYLFVLAPFVEKTIFVPLYLP